MTDITRIAMWSGPRNISTAMMRAFENRADCAVWDEPFYAHYLSTTGLDHPMRGAVIDAGEVDGQAVANHCGGAPDGPNRHGNRPTLWYQKHMTVHMRRDTPLDFLPRVRNAFLIRKPAAVLASYHDRRADPTADDIGFIRQAQLFDHICQLEGKAPPVIDSDAVLNAPEASLKSLCAALGIQFDTAMLAWPAGQRDSDGVWAAHWYKSVESSTGFAPPGSPRPLPDHLRALADSSLPYYEKLAKHTLRDGITV